WAFGLSAATTTRSVAMRPATPTSCAATITLRTNGERDDHMSFICTHPRAFAPDCSRRDAAPANHSCSPLPCSVGTAKLPRNLLLSAPVRGFRPHQGRIEGCPMILNRRSTLLGAGAVFTTASARQAFAAPPPADFERRLALVTEHDQLSGLHALLVS